MVYFFILSMAFNFPITCDLTTATFLRLCTCGHRFIFSHSSHCHRGDSLNLACLRFRGFSENEKNVFGGSENAQGEKLKMRYLPKNLRLQHVTSNNKDPAYPCQIQRPRFAHFSRKGRSVLRTENSRKLV